MSVEERLRQLRIELEMNQGEFASEVGKTQANISDMERGKASASVELVQKTCQRFSVSTHWLLTGEGTMRQSESPISLQQTVAEYIECLERNLDKQKNDTSTLQKAYAQIKEIIDNIQKFLFEQHELPIAEIPDLKTSRLLFAERVAAGNPISMTEQENARKIEVAGDYSDKKFFVVQAEGTSMTAAGIDNGDYALISSENSPKDGEIMLIWHDGCGAIKKLTQKGQDWHIVWCDGSGHSEKIADPEWKVLGIYCGKVALIR